MSASPGQGGGARGLVHLRTIIEIIGGTVMPQQVVVPDAYNAFDEQGHLRNEKLEKEIQQLRLAANEADILNQITNYDWHTGWQPSYTKADFITQYERFLRGGYYNSYYNLYKPFEDVGGGFNVYASVSNQGIWYQFLAFINSPYIPRSVRLLIFLRSEDVRIDRFVTIP